jgi:hypothetical protein
MLAYHYLAALNMRAPPEQALRISSNRPAAPGGRGALRASTHIPPRSLYAAALEMSAARSERPTLLFGLPARCTQPKLIERGTRPVRSERGAGEGQAADEAQRPRS